MMLFADAVKRDGFNPGEVWFWDEWQPAGPCAAKDAGRGGRRTREALATGTCGGTDAWRAVRKVRRQAFNRTAQSQACRGVREARRARPTEECGRGGVSSAAGFLADWWSRLDRYCKGACACQTGEDLAAHVVLGDRMVAVWYACMARGLCARKVGGRRVRCWRPSLGAGVNRRRRAAATLSVRVLASATDCFSQAQVRRSDCCDTGVRGRSRPKYRSP